MLSGQYTSYITPADRKVPPWRGEGPSKRQRDPSRAPLGGLRCTRDIQASSIDRERIASLLDSLKSATLALLQDASQYKRLSDAGGNPPRSLVSDLREDLLRVASIRYELGYVELNQCMRRKPRDDNKRSGLPNADATADRPAARTGRPVKM